MPRKSWSSSQRALSSIAIWGSLVQDEKLYFENCRSGWVSLEGRRERHQLVLLRIVYFGPKSQILWKQFSVAFLIFIKRVICFSCFHKSTALLWEDRNGCALEFLWLCAENTDVLPFSLLLLTQALDWGSCRVWTLIRISSFFLFCLLEVGNMEMFYVRGLYICLR